MISITSPLYLRHDNRYRRPHQHGGADVAHALSSVHRVLLRSGGLGGEGWEAVTARLKGRRVGETAKNNKEGSENVGCGCILPATCDAPFIETPPSVTPYKDWCVLACVPGVCVRAWVVVSARLCYYCMFARPSAYASICSIMHAALRAVCHARCGLATRNQARLH